VIDKWEKGEINGRWTMDDGRWTMDDRRWKMYHGP
jgi:hypothetical protein